MSDQLSQPGLSQSGNPKPTTKISTADFVKKYQKLKATVVEKDTLVNTLTDQLEQAVEQLDRLHRTGADRGPKSIGTSDVQRALAERLEDTLAVCEGTESQLNRISARLEDVYSLLRSGAVAPVGGVSSKPVQATAVQVKAPAPPPVPVGGGDGNFWEKMKANMLADNPVSTSGTSAPVAQATAQAEPEQAAKGQLTSEKPGLDPVPQELDLTTANAEELRQGVIERDDYIAYLIRQLRQAAPIPPIDWEAIKNSPSELAERLQLLERHLSHQIQREELELSLERAKLAREQVRLDQIRQQLETQIRRLMNTANGPVAVQAKTVDETPNRDRNWLDRLKGTVNK